MTDSNAHPAIQGTAPPDNQGQDLLHRVTATAHGAVDRLADSAGPAVHKMESAMTHANEVLHERAHRMREVGDQWTNSARHSVREHPLTAVLLGLALGVLLARASR